MEFIQIFTYLLTIISLVLFIDLYRRLGHKRLFLISIIVYLFHVALFYSTRIILIYTNIFPNYREFFTFTSWSSALRLHSVFTAFFFALIVGNYDTKLFNIVKNLTKRAE